jgi:hypothetical protein
MKVIERRRCTLEERFGLRQLPESPLVAIPRERQKRRAEAEGRQYVEPDKTTGRYARDDTHADLTSLIQGREARSNQGLATGGMNAAGSAKAPAQD